MDSCELCGRPPPPPIGGGDDWLARFALEAGKIYLETYERAMNHASI